MKRVHTAWIWKSPIAGAALAGSLFLLGATPSVHAQGSRKDDVVYNAQGRPMAGATVRVCTAAATGQPCSPLALIYSDVAMTQALANPISADGLGNYTFYAAPGRYEIEIDGPGITPKQMPNVILPSDPSTPTFTTVTTTSGISAFSLALSGNLTVTGSAAVTGSFTVGGAPVPSTTQDNAWSSSQRFKGPIPWRDFTAYMPLGGCSSMDTSDPPATGTISTGSPYTLTVSGPADFKTGCGIAVIGAGPTATLAMASTATGTAQICANPPSCTSHTGTQIMFTVSSGSIPLVPGIGNGSDAAGGLSITGCADSTFDTTTTPWLLNFGTPVTSVVYNLGGTGTSTTGCTATFYEGWAHGVAGSTTYHYKVAPIDAHGGVGTAVGPITITNGNATLSPLNYNWIGYQAVAGVREYAIYSDGGTGGAYSCINISYTQGYSDWGRPLPYGCPAYVPATPPTSPTAETLNTTIASGGGTSTLTLAAAASNNATTTNVYDDVSMFLADCINDVSNDQGPGAPSYKNFGSYGCYIPFGRWPFNADMPTDTIPTFLAGGVSIHVAGTLLFQTWPWMVTSGYSIIGEGNSGGAVNGQNFPTTFVERGLHMPSGLIVHGTNINIEGFSFLNMLGHAIVLASDPSNDSQISGLTFNRIVAQVQDGYGVGVPLQVDGNVLFASGNNMNFQPRSNGFPASILFTETGYINNSSSMSFSNIFTEWHHIVVDAPACFTGNQGASVGVAGWSSEEHGQYTTGGTIALDTGTPGVPCGSGTTDARLAGAGISGISNSDSSNKTLLSILGSQTANATISVSGDVFYTQPRCDNGSPSCANGGVSLSLTVGSAEEPTAQASPYIGTVGPYLIRYPVLFSEGYGQSGPNWATEIPAPYILESGAVGSGGLAAGTYCFVVVGLDMQSTPGYTLPSPEFCSTVGASSGIYLDWKILAYNYYSNYRLYFGSSSGNENQYFTVGPQNATDITYLFNTTSGASAGAPPTGFPPISAGTAYSSWLGGNGCFGCIPSNAGFQLGIGEPSPPSGDELAVKNGVLDAESGFKSALSTKSSAYTLTTSDYWVNVTGSTTITVPHASAGNHWVVFNSGSGTVTVQADSGNINGAANITLAANVGKEIACDGTNCFAH